MCRGCTAVMRPLEVPVREASRRPGSISSTRTSSPATAAPPSGRAFPRPKRRPPREQRQRDSDSPCGPGGSRTIAPFRLTRITVPERSIKGMLTASGSATGRPFRRGKRPSTALVTAPRCRSARRFAPGIETSLRACGARRQVPICSCFFVKGGVPPFHTFPPDTRAANGVRCHCFCSVGAVPFDLTGCRARSPTGRAGQRSAFPCQRRHLDCRGFRRGCIFTASGRHRWAKPSESAY